ncbi:MAG: thioredoxin family protein [Ferruginibacter sp.]
MYKIIFSFALILFLQPASAQTPYTSILDGETRILNGIVTKYILQNDSSFKWYGTNQAGYTPNAGAVTNMEVAKGTTQYVVFGGTWCSDTQNILPKFFKLQEASGVADKQISFFAVDRSKKTIGNIGDAFKITNVPTIIVMRDGKELGRVVEYGKSGSFDKELAEILK